MNAVAALLVAYLIGSVLPADLISRWRGVDIRSYGTRNPGTTNAWIVLGPGAGVATGVVDVSKGLIALWIGSRLGVAPPWLYAVGIAAVVGHRLPVWHRFRGGQGTATTTGLLLYCLGVALMRDWVPISAMTVIALVAAVVFAVFRSGTVVGLAVLPLVFLAILRGSPDAALVTFSALTFGYVWVIQIVTARHERLLTVSRGPIAHLRGTGAG